MRAAPKRKLGQVVPYVGVFVLGVVVGCGLTFVTKRGRAYGQMVTVAGGDLVQDVELAAQLRLGEPEPVLGFLEQRIDSETLSVALTPGVRKTERVERALRLAKAYRALVPSTSGSAADVAEALKGVPDGGPPPNPKSPLGRLLAQKQP